VNKRKKLLEIACLVVIGAILINVGYVRAQSILEGKLTGTIADDKGELLPGASVEITSPALMGKRTAVTSAKGLYVFLSLPGGKYKVTVSMPGFKTTMQENIEISAGRVVTVDLALQAGAIEEQVTVIAESPVVDSKTSTVFTKLERQMLDKLPTSRDAFYDLSLTTPGMFDVGSQAGWMPSPTAYGSTQNENVFLVNGVNTTNPRGANFGSMVRVNYNAVEEVRIVALGTKAEYGNFSGAAIDVLTKSGSNTFHGSLGFYSQLKKPENNQPAVNAELGRDWLFMAPGDELINQTHQDLEVNLTFGGPIVKDKVWFYGGFDYINAKTKTPVWQPLQGDGGRFGDLKISAEPLSMHRAWFAYHYESNKMDGQNWGAWSDPTVTNNLNTMVQSISSQWQWLPNSKTIFTAKYLGFWTKDEPWLPEPAAGAPTWPAYINWWKLGKYEVNGVFPWIEAMDSNRHTVQADVSYFAENFLGEHDIKFGAQYTVGKGSYLGGYFQGYVNYAYPNGYAGYYIPNLINYPWYYGAYDDGAIFRNDKTYKDPFLTVRKGIQLGFFLDDQWTPTKRLTINLGLRLDKTTARYGEGKIYEVPTTPDLRNPLTEVSTRAATDNIYDFSNISPRIGLTYALSRDRKTVARASFGRYYMPLTLENLNRFGPHAPQTSVHRLLYRIPWDEFDTNPHNNYMDPAEVEYWTRQLHDMTSYSDTWIYDDQSWQLQVSPDLKNQFTDQLTFNLERELFKDLSLSASYIFRHTGNLMAQIPINEATGEEWVYETKPYTTSKGVDVMLYSIVKGDYDGVGGATMTGADLQWISDHNNFEVRNVGEYFGVKAKRDYHGLQLVLNKRYSERWQALASVVYSISTGTAARSIHQDFNVEGVMVTNDYWMSNLNNLVNNMDGPLPFTPKFEFKLSGSYLVPVVDLDLGIRFRMHTGRPVWAIESYGNVAATWMGTINDEMIVQPSSGGYSSSIVSVDPKEPDYLPGQAILDLHVEKAFPLKNFGRIRLIIDAFNVFNSGTVTNVFYDQWGYGQVTGLISPPRKFRGSIVFEF